MHIPESGGLIRDSDVSGKDHGRTAGLHVRAELMELVGIPTFAACLAALGVQSLNDFAECVDVEEGHDAQLQGVLEALPATMITIK